MASFFITLTLSSGFAAIRAISMSWSMWFGQFSPVKWVDSVILGHLISHHPEESVLRCRVSVPHGSQGTLATAFIFCLHFSQS